ncbi:hypothetical protein D3C80_499710 [compost metagenome]
MGHDRRMLDQAFHTAQALGQGKNAHALQKAFGTGQVAVEVHRNHPAKTPHLPPGQAVLGVRDQARVVNPCDLRLAFQPMRQFQGVAAVALHAQGQGFHPAQGQKGIERPGDRPHRVL